MCAPKSTRVRTPMSERLMTARVMMHPSEMMDWLMWQLLTFDGGRYLARVKMGASVSKRLNLGMVAGEDEERVDLPIVNVRHHLAHGVGCALKPIGAVGRLLGGEDFDEAVGELREAVGARDVAVEAGRVVLRQHEDAQDVGVDAVRDRDVHEPVLAAQRHGRLRARQSQRRKARARAAAQNNRKDVRPLRSHHCTPPGLCSWIGSSIDAKRPRFKRAPPRNSPLAVTKECPPGRGTKKAAAVRETAPRAGGTRRVVASAALAGVRVKETGVGVGPGKFPALRTAGRQAEQAAGARGAGLLTC